MASDSSISNVEFARQAGFLAKNAADWSSDALSPAEGVARPMGQEPLDRFLSEMRKRLDLIEDLGRGG